MEAIKQADGTWDIKELEPWQNTFIRICELIRMNIQFKFARYGDGEIFCMDGRKGHNCDKHEYFPDLGKALRDGVQKADYMVGIQPLSVAYFHNISYFSHLSLYNADVLHNASIQGRLFELLEACAGRPVIIVGPKHLEFFTNLLIETPPLNCWLKYEEICTQLEDKLKWLDPIGDATCQAVVFLCASMMSEVIIDRFKDWNATFIDCGSVFDPYVGVKSRRYHHNLEIQ